MIIQFLKKELFAVKPAAKSFLLIYFKKGDMNMDKINY